MREPTPTDFDAKIRADGRISKWFIERVADVQLPDQVIISSERPTILAGNHQSLLDILLATAACHNAGLSARLLVQAAYFDQWIGRWLRRIGCIPLNTKTKDAAFEIALASLEKFELVGIMPEGRLVPPDERSPQTGPFRAGVAELARRSGAEVRPIAFHNSGIVWPRNKWPRRVTPRPTVTLRIGEPIPLPFDDDQHNADVIREGVTALLDELDAAHT